MILTCPSCSTRYTVDEAKFPPAGRTVRCAKCGHSWHQSAPAPEPVPEPVAIEPTADIVAPPEESVPFTPASTTRAYAPPAQMRDEPRGQTLQMVAVAAGWIGLIAVVLLIGWSAVRYRQDIAAIWPQTASVYSGMGLKVNAGGIDFRNVDKKYEREDGQPVLVVTGQIVNLASRELPVPQSVRITLTDADNRELYHWSVKPAAPTLKAGGVLPFRTRLSSPPAAARFAVVSFAKD
ncbi:MAG: zinc-ribbon domain-containing protein [Alphaproteobacteria bacterium]|nr:zinc-ribbon domain-containing protein [Alphaproteobacteria bacterium]